MSQSDPQFYEGANWMLNAVRSSIENYPDAGGDIEVMARIDAVYNSAIDDVLDILTDSFTLSAVVPRIRELKK